MCNMAAATGKVASVLVLISACVISSAQDVLKYSIYEHLPAGAFVGDVREDSKLRSTASAEDFSQIDYSLLKQGKLYESLFRVNSVNGSMFTEAVIDRENISECVYETKCLLPISIVAKSKISAFFRTLKVNITVIDINDHAPGFPVDVTSLKISEVANVGSSFAVVGATDADTGNYSIQRYFIKNENSLNLPFTTSYETYVDGTSVVKLQIKGDLDRESRDTYSVVIVAEDGGAPSLTGTMTVNIQIDDVNDNAPEFTRKEYFATVNETLSIGSEIIKLSATDADIGVNSEIAYRLSRNQIGKIQEQFELNANTGSLTLKQKFYSGGEFKIIVEASDKGTQPLISQAVVTVTVADSHNNRPKATVNLFSKTDLASVSEFADIGTVVAHIAIEDKDTGANGVIVCDIASDNGTFKLQSYDDNEYKVTVAQALDREETDLIYVIVMCNDLGSPPETASVKFGVQVVDENDHSPVFVQDIYFVDILENNAKDIDVVHVSAIDKDIGNNSQVSYSLWAPVPYRFTMDPLSGGIRAQSVFDRERDSTITFYAYAKDNGLTPRTSTATIQINILDENDNDPKFDRPIYEFKIMENEPMGSRIGNVSVSDADADRHGRIGLYIDAALPFQISNKGEITTKEPLDREAKSTYSFLVMAFDHGVPSRNTSVNMVIFVGDQNDNSPRFVFPDIANYTVEVDSESLPRSVIAKIKAFDLDDGKNSQLFYSIENSQVSNLFAIDANTGDLLLMRALFESDPQIFNLGLRVEDKGNPSRHATTSMNIFVVRKERAAPITDTKGENLLIAITVSAVTFVLVFTIILVLCILRRRWNSRRNNSGSESKFCGNDKEGRRVTFADKVDAKSPSPVRDSRLPALESMTTFSSDGNDSSDMTSSTVDLETPILEKQMNISKEKASPVTRSDLLPRIPEARALHHSTPRSDVNQPHYDNIPLSEYQLSALEKHSAVLNSTIKPHGSSRRHDDNHSQTSADTITSDSGRGGSESDIQITSLSLTFDSDIKHTSDTRLTTGPKQSTFLEPPKAWLNLADLRYHNCHKLPVAQQLHDDRKHRLQLRNLGERKSSRPVYPSTERTHGALRTQSDGNINKMRLPVLPRQTAVLSTQAADIDQSFMTYTEEDDDMSTTTSGSYTIDEEDISLDLRSPIPRVAGLRSCIV
ncbi:protocadherin-11 X-linked-like [Dreissena polymorpha]|uniref:Cadherin domain-containing protein n=1 Tax=Dreissena polymorpha TaxID=45954 RepID=A0A9D4KNP3_DREPO|nr:protocadherin-11 X-linked-like [Dreissena polymorpha]KAH3843290.1 hypothetical protein DPMN_116803 [Dreissena polymorpha]